jgi:hypothetical protein
MITRTFTKFSLLLILGSVLSPSILEAATIGYWRFENSPGFLSDSSGNGNTLTVNGTVAQAALPSGIRGASFPNPIPSSNLTNNFAADFAGTSDYLSDSALASTPTANFTVESLVHWENSANNNESFSDIIVSTRDASSNIGFFLQIRTDGFNGTNPNGELFLSFNDGTANRFVNSGFSPLSNTDYYFAAAANMSGGIATFYVKDLTNNGALQTINVPHSGLGGLNSANILEIGSSAISVDGFDFDGLIDEVRISNTYLTANQLLIAPPPVAPEPSSLSLFALGAVGLLRRTGLKQRKS